jgi:outer membrane protein W
MRFLRHVAHRHSQRLAATLLFLASASASAAQEASTAAFGVRAIGAVGFHAGRAFIERNAEAYEIGARVDVGHFQTNQIRVIADISFLRTLTYEEFVPSEDTTYRDVFYDLSGHVLVQWFLRDPSRRFAPYAMTGVGVHALTSSFSSIVLDQRYNTNNFGLRAGAGVRVRLGSGRRRAVFVEYDATLVRGVSRGSVHLGVEALFADLAQSR